MIECRTQPLPQPWRSAGAVWVDMAPGAEAWLLGERLRCALDRDGGRHVLRLSLGDGERLRDVDLGRAVIIDVSAIAGCRCILIPRRIRAAGRRIHGVQLEIAVLEGEDGCAGCAA